MENLIPRWLTSDTHFGHGKIREYEPVRQAWSSSTEEMDRVLIQNWNRVVQPEDWVLHCGDFCFGTRDEIERYRSQLNGRILLVLGNHDRSSRAMLAGGFDLACKSYRFTHNGQRFLARHNPANFTWEESLEAEVLLHGHTHSKKAPESVPPQVRNKCFPLSVEHLPGQTPISLESLLERLPTGGFQP